MRRILRWIGMALSVVYPYRLHAALISATEIVYTGWRIRGFRQSYLTDKFGKNLHLAGIQYISLGENVYIGGGGSHDSV